MTLTIDDHPTVDQALRAQAQAAYVDADPDGLWATHVLVCSECGGCNVAAPAGTKRDILDDGLPVPETCAGCEQTTRQYDVRALDRRTK